MYSSPEPIHSDWNGMGTLLMMWWNGMGTHCQWRNTLLGTWLGWLGYELSRIQNDVATCIIHVTYTLVHT